MHVCENRPTPLCELDSRALDRYGDGVPLAWSYVLVVPISVVLSDIFPPLLSG